MSDVGVVPASQRQHYISKHLINRWAKNGKVGVVCTYHRDSAIVPAEELHSVVDVWPQDLENSWNATESDAAHATNGLRKALRSRPNDFEAMKDVLSNERNFAALIDLAVLHHARSVAVLIQRMADLQAGVANTDVADMIRERWIAALGYRECGLVVTVLPEDTPIGLGAVPVFHAPHWDGPKPDAPALFMMPLTPRMLVAADLRMDAGEVHVVPDEIGHEMLFTLALAGERRLLSTPYLICKPSALDQTARTVLDITEGNPMHWMALYDRMRLHWGDASAQQRVAWRRLVDERENRQGRHDDVTTSNAMREKHRQWMRASARTLQAELDRLGVANCYCDDRRDETSDPDLAALWGQVMPEVVCQAIRGVREERR